MKKVYIILTYTGTALAHLIRLTTKDEFAHVSISLDENLKEMYSFGRLNPYNPFFGGFVHESLEQGTFKRFENKTISKIYILNVTDYQYRKLKRQIKFMIKRKSKYKFNILGLILAKFRYKLSRSDCYYCAEFVKKIMDESNIENNLPEAVKPEDFKNLKNIDLLYSGMLKDFTFQLNNKKNCLSNE